MSESPPQAVPPALNVRKLGLVALVFALAFGVQWLPLGDLDGPARVCLSIFVAAAALWITELIPPFATAIAVIVASVYLLGDPVGGDAGSYQAYLDPFASPVLVLFFGGFVLEAGATKHGLSQRMAKWFIRPFGTRPALVLLGTILTTGLFALFMSNTATTAMMLAILAPVFARIDRGDPFRRAMGLAVPFAANVGGMGTIVASPPNGIVATNLATVGEKISFSQWMGFGLPVACVLLVVHWVLLVAQYRPKTRRLEILFPEPLPVTADLVVVAGTFTLTIALWMTEALHGIPAALSALIPVTVFTSLGILDGEDLKKLSWDVLILVAGGVALGEAMKASGLAAEIASLVSSLPTSPYATIVILAAVGAVVSAFMSNTSAANLLVPIAISLAADMRREAAIVAGLSVSLGMILPISTPPNALATATGTFSTGDMIRGGTLLTIAGLIALAVLAAVM